MLHVWDGEAQADRETAREVAAARMKIRDIGMGPFESLGDRNADASKVVALSLRPPRDGTRSR